MTRRQELLVTGTAILILGDYLVRALLFALLLSTAGFMAVVDAANTVLDAEMIFALAREQSHILGALTFRQLTQIAAVMANNSRLMPTIQLARFDGDIHLYVVTRRPPDFDRVGKNPKAWEPYCGGAIRTIAIDSTHNKMLSPAALKQIGSLPLPS